ncbi:MAG: UpxY family transcription antiterminator [Runella slithyformis]|nr:MAG: UpxY family transcription antiterminator [Runella slithyformis]TAF28122.1 MAG: UpxY family transcription antiterminator [Runella slithyformis]TAF46726.1 MAG: UpxY family transcription antiterminator [Runella slithyformis]TAF81565.1 MAG: UpxY family transcription antiterminator [Runella slithyformis]
MPWFVIYTKSKSEKIVANGLRKKKIEVYCPLRKVQRKWSDRIKIVEEPLFRSYCFVHLEEKERALVFDTPGVVRYLFWDKKPAIVRQQEIDVIKDLLNDFDHATIEALTFAPDDKIIIESGAFSSQEAQVTATQGKQIIVKIDSLGMFISINTTKNKVKKIV